MKQVCFLWHVSVVFLSTPLVLISDVKVPSEVVRNGESMLSKHRQIFSERKGFSDKDKGELARLLKDLYFVSHLCQRSLDSDEKLLDWIENSKEPMAPEVTDIHDFLVLYQASIDRSELTPEESYDEFNLLRMDCLFNCREYKQTINKMIPEVLAMMNKKNEFGVLPDDIVESEK